MTGQRSFSRKNFMQDGRWTIRDQITQYKGLVRLYERDKILVDNDKNVAEKKSRKRLHNLKHDIVEHRQKLDVAVKENQPKRKVLLAGHRKIQILCAGYTSSKTVEYLEQNNFSKRKCIDRLDAQIKQRRKQLADLKLEASKLQDKLACSSEPLPTDDISRVLSSKIQDALLKLDAAVAIEHSYRQILAVIKKDRIYFESVLDQLNLHRENQHRCIFNVTKVGQMAVENTDDLKTELSYLMKLVVRDWKFRTAQMEMTEVQLGELRTDLRLLVAFQAANRNGGWKVKETEDDLLLENDIERLEAILKQLKHITVASRFQDICSSINNQSKKNPRLFDLQKTMNEQKEELLNKLKPAREIWYEMKLGHEAETFDHENDTEKLKQEITTIGDKYLKKENECLKLQNTFNMLRFSLRHLESLCRVVEDRPRSRKQKMLQDDNSEVSDDKMFEYLEEKIKILMESYTGPFETISDYANARKCFQTFMGEISSKVVDTKDKDLILIEEAPPNDLTVFTCEDIKQQSTSLCKAHIVSEWMK